MEDLSQIGQTIKNYRKEKGMTMKELAEKANVTVSMLSQIESSQANPSLNTLRLIAAALEVPLFRLFMTDEGLSATPEIVAAENRSYYYNNGIRYELITPDLAGDLSGYLMYVSPGNQTAESPLGHKGEEIGFQLSGTLELVTDTATYLLHPGDSVRIPEMLPHCWHNSGTEDAVYLFAVRSSGF